MNVEVLRNKMGFTIVELLVVIAIIGILATMIVVMYTGMTQRAIAVSLQSDLSSSSELLKVYDAYHHHFPVDDQCPTPDEVNICLKPSQGNTLTYVPAAGVAPQSFTLIATNGSVSYIITDDTNPIAFTSFFAVGGTITYVDSNGLNPRSSPAYTGGYTVHTFTSDGTFTVYGTSLSGQALIVGGGGSGGGGSNSPAAYGGGGGGGGVLEGSLTITPGDHIVDIGSGGAGVSPQTRGNSGQNTSFGSIIAYGGGGGGAVVNTSNKNGLSGGSGGGGGGAYSGAAGTATQASVGGLTGYGYNGAAGQATWAGGGAGGAGHAGYQIAPWGGAGRASTINGSVYAAGGPISDAVVSGGANTGNGGTGNVNVTSGSGGSGIVIVRYLTP